MELSQHGLIGNCQISALVRSDGAIVWSCLPRFDSPPVFGQLLDESHGGSFSIRPAEDVPGTQRYLPNTNVLETRFSCADGVFRVLDFAPRFIQFERNFRPKKLVRIVEPLEGTPRIRVSCDPVLGWSQERPRKEYGSHHISFGGYPNELRLTTDASLSYLEGNPFVLSRKSHFVLAWGAPVEEPLQSLCERFLRETESYWRTWVKHCNIPPLYQEQVIRSALALKLHCYEDTGAIVAAHTTSIPESPGSGRTWDYRYCWLRDAYYSLDAFRLLGQFEERDQFLEFLLNIAGSSRDLDLAPLYRIDGRSDLDEHVLQNWSGYKGEQPVRVGNGAATHKQYDVFGEMVLALAPLFLDLRFRERVTSTTLDLVVRLARKAVEVAGRPDAGIWEFREGWRPQTFSSLMCWAAADRMTLVSRVHAPSMTSEFQSASERIRREILEQAVDLKRGCLVADHGGTEVDAALLQAVSLRFLDPNDKRLHATVHAVREDLEFHGWLKRYRTNDGFGVPSVAFMLCTFWEIEALANLGRLDEARARMEWVLQVKSPLGLLSEDLHPLSGLMMGNYPQAYSHVGLIHAAFAASPRWTDFGS